MFTEGMKIPPKEDLIVEEINLSTSRWHAGSQHLGKYREKPSQEFVLCNRENKDPRACIDEGKTLTACGADFFRMVKKGCLEEFEQFATCVDRSSEDYALYPCRNTQAVFDKCMLDKFDLRRPNPLYYLRPKVLDTEKPKPRGYVSPDFPEEPKDITFPKHIHDGYMKDHDRLW